MIKEYLTKEAIKEYNKKWREAHPDYYSDRYEKKKWKLKLYQKRWYKLQKKKKKDKILRDINPTEEDLALMKKGIYSYLAVMNKKRPYGAYILYDDCVADAYDALVRGIYNFRIKKNNIKSNWSTYCKYRVYYGMIDSYRKEFGRSGKVDKDGKEIVYNGMLNVNMIKFSAMEAGLDSNHSLNDIFGEDKSKTLSYEDKELSNFIEKDLNDRLISASIKMYKTKDMDRHRLNASLYFLRIKGLTQKEIGKNLGISESRISQIILEFKPVIEEFKKHVLANPSIYGRPNNL